MHLETLNVDSTSPYRASCRSSETSRAEHNVHEYNVHEEQSWRCLTDTDRRLPAEAEIVVSRWIDSRSYCRHDQTASWSDRYIIGIALKTTRLKLTRDSHTVFDGIMPRGTVHVTGPFQPLAAEFHAPCDFVHFHVASNYLRILRDRARYGSHSLPDLNDLVIRDPLAELLGRTLVESGRVGDGLYAESARHTLVMHVARLERPQGRVHVLPKWRLKRVREHIDAHLDEGLSLADLAAVAGLSRMHFAAQFRAATGYRPHDYLLYRRIESSKVILSGSDMPLAEVALAVGFHAQAHFSTVFKRMTGETPARWRRAVISERQFLDPREIPDSTQIPFVQFRQMHNSS
jgi:AraC family transcriptional regulator